MKARFKLGIGRFEAILNQIGLGGPRIHEECLDELRKACSTANHSIKQVSSDIPRKVSDEIATVRNPGSDRTQMESISQRSASNELKDILLKEDRKELRKAAYHSHEHERAVEQVDLQLLKRLRNKKKLQAPANV